MDLNKFFDSLRGKNQDEEDENAKNAEAFEAGPGRGAPNAPEDPAREIGSETEAEKLQSSQMKQGSMPFGLAGGFGVAEKAGEAAGSSGLLSRMSNAVPEVDQTVHLTPARQAVAAEQLRLTGQAQLYNKSGQLVKTIGTEHPLAERLIQNARANINETGANAPGVTVGRAKAPTTFSGTATPKPGSPTGDY